MEVKVERKETIRQKHLQIFRSKRQQEWREMRQSGKTNQAKKCEL